MSPDPSAIRLPNGRLLSRASGRERIFALRRDAIMGKLEPAEEINLITDRWLNEESLSGGDGTVLEARLADYGNFLLKDGHALFAIYDPACYQSFVSSFWDNEKMQEHFIDQMRNYRSLVCSLGFAGDWLINIQHQPVLQSGLREISGSVMAAGSRLILSDYSHLTMGAQFKEIKLPDDEPYGAYEIRVEPGTYNIRILQMHEQAGESDRPDIILEILKAQNPLPFWTELAWVEFGRSC
ncbi:MAG: hypothetical protein K2X27_11385 [Candidatus Obscuribacterales bacterium]|nr:hypothetical protein [Candidatus Obscuribacterales bacterium]